MHFVGAGVEHLLRDVKDATISTLATDVAGKMMALKGLHSRLEEIQSYLAHVAGGTLPLNHEIMEHLQVRGAGRGAGQHTCISHIVIVLHRIVRIRDRWLFTFKRHGKRVFASFDLCYIDTYRTVTCDADVDIISRWVLRPGSATEPASVFALLC